MYRNSLCREAREQVLPRASVPRSQYPRRNCTLNLFRCTDSSFLRFSSSPGLSSCTSSARPRIVSSYHAVDLSSISSLPLFQNSSSCQVTDHTKTALLMPRESPHVDVPSCRLTNVLFLSSRQASVHEGMHETDLGSRPQVWASPYHVAHALAVVERIMDTVPALRAAPDAPQAAAVAAEVCVERLCTLCMFSGSWLFRLASFSTLVEACHCSSLIPGSLFVKWALCL